VVSVGDAYQMDCRYCEIQVEITKRAYNARCPNPAAVLDYIRVKLQGSTRPRVDLPDMKRQPPPRPIEENMTSNEKQPETTTDLLTTAAKAIGTTLGQIAVKTGMAKPPARVAKAPKKAATKKRAAATTNKKTVSPKTPKPKKTSPRAKTAKPVRKRTRGN
jgi:hypothetical protein